jgi:hypothetical protein
VASRWSPAIRRVPQGAPLRLELQARPRLVKGPSGRILLQHRNLGAKVWQSARCCRSGEQMRPERESPVSETGRTHLTWRIRRAMQKPRRRGLLCNTVMAHRYRCTPSNRRFPCIVIARNLCRHSPLRTTGGGCRQGGMGEADDPSPAEAGEGSEPRPVGRAEGRARRDPTRGGRPPPPSAGRDRRRRRPSARRPRRGRRGPGSPPPAPGPPGTGPARGPAPR